MLYPTYTVNGVPMFDQLGRWHEHEKMSIFPAHPGLRATMLSFPGVGGEVPLPQAPHEPGKFVLHMVVNAVNPDTGVNPNTYAERLVQLAANASELFTALEIPRMTQGGSAVLERMFSPSERHTAYGRLIASSEIDFEPGADWAEYRFIFHIASGVWHGQAVNALFDGIGVERVTGLSRSTAPIDGPVVTLGGPFTYMEVTNRRGNGFGYTQGLAAGQHVSIDTLNWTVSPIATHSGTLPATPATGTYSISSKLRAVGQTSGVALTLLPEREGAQVTFTGTGRVQGQTAARIMTSEAFF